MYEGRRRRRLGRPRPHRRRLPPRAPLPRRGRTARAIPGVRGGPDCRRPHLRELCLPMSPFSRMLLTVASLSLAPVALGAADAFHLERAWTQRFDGGVSLDM